MTETRRKKYVAYGTMALSAFLPGFGRNNLATALVYLVLGIGLGMAVNGLNMIMSRKFRKVYRSPWAAAPLHLVPVVMVLFALKFLVPSFARNMTSTIPGVFFVAFFFGTQFAVMARLVQLYLQIPIFRD